MEIFPGDFFYHNEYGVGQVTQVFFERSAPEVEIKFANRLPVIMTAHLLVRSSERISPEGFRVLAFNDREKANKLIVENPVEVIRSVLQDSPSFKSKTEDIKIYLAPYISSWDRWWEKAQPLLKENPSIDTTNSKAREYSLAREVHSLAEEAYLSFISAKQRWTQPGELANRAHKALVLKQNGEALPEEHSNELLNFLKQMVFFEKYDLPVRLSVLYSLHKEKLISPDETNEWLDKFLIKDIKLYLLDAKNSQWIIEEILKHPLREYDINILASGICSTSATVTHNLLLWAMKQANADIIARFLVTALTENIPPALGEEKYPTLKYRLEACIELVKCLPEDHPAWSEVLIAFKQLNVSLSLISKKDNFKLLLSTFINLANVLHNHVKENYKDEDHFIESLASPTYPLDYTLIILDSASNSEYTKELSTKIEGYLFDHADRHNDNMLAAFIETKWKNHIDQANEIIKIIKNHTCKYFISKGGEIICEYARQADEIELINLLPCLDQLHLLLGDWSWRTALESFREKGYLAMYTGSQMGKTYRDNALVNAAQQFTHQKLREIESEVKEKQVLLESLQDQVRILLDSIDKKETVLRELRGNMGGDSEEARFEERSRILKDFVVSIAEFERFYSSQAEQSREMEAMIKRLYGVLSSYKVMITEPIGSQVDFNPQKHHVIESRDVVAGDKVVVLERGYLLRDYKEKLRLLKPALVKKI